MQTQFTPREVAQLSGAPKRTVEKAIEEKVFTVTKVKRGRRVRRVLPAHAVAYATIMRTVKYRMNPTMKRKLMIALRAGGGNLKILRFELEPAVELDVGRLVGDSMDRAAAYGATRDLMIVENEDVLGGTPAIRGTRISVYAILGRLTDGETIADLVADYPDLTPETIEAAAIYARSHPLVGRPGGRPWSAAA